MNATCPWCSAPRDAGPACPSCGAIYAKAEAIKAHGRAAPGVQPALGKGDFDSVSSTGPGTVSDDGTSPNEWSEVEDAELEWKFCLGAIPIALFVAILFQVTSFGAALQRIFLTMPVHEFGHAVTAWFCGYTAIPTLWQTLVPDSRGFIAPVLLCGGLAYAAYRAQSAGNVRLVCVGAGLILLQAILTFGIKPETARMLITFGGDGMGMILATLLMSTFFFGKRTKLYKGSLRWGFLVIGAAAFIDIYATWWKARKDEGAVPYGTTGGMATDAMTLVDTYGWTFQTLINRYVVLGLCCLLALALVYAWGVLKAKREMENRRNAGDRPLAAH